MHIQVNSENILNAFDVRNKLPLSFQQIVFCTRSGDARGRTLGGFARLLVTTSFYGAGWNVYD